MVFVFAFERLGLQSMCHVESVALIWIFDCLDFLIVRGSPRTSECIVLGHEHGAFMKH